MSRTLDEQKEQILLHLKKFDYLNIKQISVMVGLSESYIYKIMKQLNSYVRTFTDNRMTVYYLSKEGREFTRSEKVRRKLTTAQHYIMRTNLYIYLGQPESWKNEVRIKYTYDKADPKSRKIMVVADGHYVCSDNRHHIIEIDNEQKMHKNKIKIEKYRRLTEKGVFKGIPELIWVTTTEYRRKMLLELCTGLDVKVLLRGDLI